MMFQNSIGCSRPSSFGGLFSIDKIRLHRNSKHTKKRVQHSEYINKHRFSKQNVSVCDFERTSLKMRIKAFPRKCQKNHLCKCLNEAQIVRLREKDLQSQTPGNAFHIHETPLNTVTPPAMSRDWHWVLSMPAVVPSDIDDGVFRERALRMFRSVPPSNPLVLSEAAMVQRPPYMPSPPYRLAETCYAWETYAVPCQVAGGQRVSEQL